MVRKRWVKRPTDRTPTEKISGVPADGTIRSSNARDANLDDPYILEVYKRRAEETEEAEKKSTWPKPERGMRNP